MKMKSHINCFFGVALAASITVGAMAADNSSSLAKERIATFAGGCFWCVESDFDHVPGVLRTISGYTGGKLKNPTYRSVSRSGTGHREAVQIIYDPKRVTYVALLEVFWRSVDRGTMGQRRSSRDHETLTSIQAQRRHFHVRHLNIWDVLKQAQTSQMFR